MLEALIVVVPDTDKSVTLEIAPLNTALPVIVRPFAPPATVELKVALVPVSAILPVAKLTAPVYVCVPEVVISPFKVMPLPVMARLPAEVMAATETAP